MSKPKYVAGRPFASLAEFVMFLERDRVIYARELCRALNYEFVICLPFKTILNNIKMGRWVRAEKKTKTISTPSTPFNNV